MRDAFIIDAVRTPVGKGKASGALHSVHPVELHSHVLRSLVERTGVDAATLDDVIGGAVTQAGEQASNTTRWAVLGAGFPESVSATTVDRQCGSSQQALHFAAQGIRAGVYDLVIASGVESMSRAPMQSNVGTADPFGPSVSARYSEGLIPQGISAELIANKWNLSRALLDEYAAISHQRAAQAWSDGRFDDEVAAGSGDGDERSGAAPYLLSSDEGVRPDTSTHTLAGLKPAFRAPQWEQRFPELDWRITAGNSSPLSDGAAAVLLASADAVERYGLRPRARVHEMTVAADDPVFMLTAVIPATENVLRRAGLTLNDIDAIEINEAFASVVLAWQAETGADLARVNVHGGAIAIGHPLGGSGARIMTTLLSVLEQHGGRFGLQLMCEAGGQANATIVERLSPTT